VEPTIGEQLCRLFPLDENIDLRRIAQIARQSLKRRDPGTGKTTSASSRSASDLSSQPAPPGLSAAAESSSNRSDKLLLGLYRKDGVRTPMQCGDSGLTRTSREIAAVGSWRCSLHNSRTYFTDVLSLLRSNELLKTGLGRMVVLMDIQIISSLLRLHELAKTRLGRMQMNIPRGTFIRKFCCLCNGLSSGLYCKILQANQVALRTLDGMGLLTELSVLLTLWDVKCCFDQLNSWSVNLLRKCPHWISLLSWTLPAFLWTLVKLSVGAFLFLVIIMLFVFCRECQKCHNLFLSELCQISTKFDDFLTYR